VGVGVSLRDLYDGSANDASDAMTNGSRAAIDAKLSRDVRAHNHLCSAHDNVSVPCSRELRGAACRFAIAYRDLD
jgi:hypothetical protein